MSDDPYIIYPGENYPVMLYGSEKAENLAMLKSGYTLAEKAKADKLVLLNRAQDICKMLINGAITAEQAEDRITNLRQRIEAE